MSEKPEALAERLAAGRLAMVEQLTDEVEALRRENERLREVLNRFEYSSDGHIKRYPEEEEVIAALRREET